MRSKWIFFQLVLLVFAILFVSIAFQTQLVSGQTDNPLVSDRPVTVVRKQKKTRVRPARPRPAVQKVKLLRLEWRVLKVNASGATEETSPLAVFHVGDRLRLAVKTNQSGYLYIIHQDSPTQPGQIIFPDSRVNGGRNDVDKATEFILPSNCPAGTNPRDCSLVVTPPAGQELFTLIFSRDPFTDLPTTAAAAGGGIPVESLLKLKADSGQTLRRVKGSTPLSVVVINTNTKDNEDIFETLVLNKGQ